MPDIIHQFTINTPVERVFEGVTTPTGLDSWWTKSSSGEPAMGSEYQLGFGPEYQWQAKVTRYVPNAKFDLIFTRADRDWVGTRVSFVLESKNGSTQVLFKHANWREDNEHYRVSSYCWAMYLRILKRSLEHGEVVEYERRLEA